MARISLNIQERTKIICGLLADRVNEPTRFKPEPLLELKWLRREHPVGSGIKIYKLLVRSDLSTLARLIAEQSNLDLKPHEIRYVLIDVLRDYLGFLDDLRWKDQGSRKWLFLLTWSSRDKNAILDEIDREFTKINY